MGFSGLGDVLEVPLRGLGREEGVLFFFIFEGRPFVSSQWTIDTVIILQFTSSFIPVVFSVLKFASRHRNWPELFGVQIKCVST